MTDRPAIRLMISGRVQGVGYRYWTVGEARRLGLEGWVRNLSDGRVEILALGPQDRLDRLENSCHAGPSSARVSAVARSLAADDGSRGFREKPTSEAGSGA
jgi:acylphosphatase